MKRYLISLLLILGVISSAVAVSEEECVSAALEHNLGIKSNEALLKASEMERRSSLTDFLPRVDALGNYTYLNDPAVYDLEEKFVDLMTGVQDFSTYLNQAHAEDPNWGAVSDLYDPAQSSLYNLLTEMYDAGLLDEEFKQELGSEDNWVLGVNVTQPLFTGGKLWEKYQISKSMQKLTESQLEQKKQEVIYETQQRYWLVIKLEARRELAESYLETISSYEEDVQNYLTEGIVTGNELLTVQVKRHDAELKLLKVRNGIALARMALNQIMGNKLDECLELSDSLPQTVEYKPDPGSRASALEHRPELISLAEGVKMSRSAQKIASSRYFPNIVLTGNYFTLNPNPYNSFEEEFGSSWSVGITAQWEIFSWNQRGYQVKAAQHRRESLKKQLEEVEEMVSLELQQAEYQAEESVAKVKMCERNMQASEDNLKQMEERYGEGLVNMSDLLEARTMWYDAGCEEIEAKVEYVLQKASVKKATGELYMK